MGGCKLLPNLKILELHCLSKLITTPDFDGLPNVERFTLSECECLEEIHPSIGRLERLVFLSIKFCSKFKRFPPISRLKKLETLSFSYCPKLFSVVDNIPDVHLDNSGKEVASYQPCTGFFVTCWMCGCSNLPGVECCLPHNNKNRIGLLRFFHGLQELGLRKLNLSSCQLGDEDIGSGVWELPNLQELNLESNKFSRLSFSQVRLPQLKWLNVTNCYCLVELSELPSSIAVINADGCSSLESFGDVSNCKWLWKVSFHGSYKVHPLYGYKLLDSMLQGNAIEYHFISVGLQPQIRKNFVGRFFRGNTFTIRYPHLKVDSNSVRIRHDRDCTFKLRLPEDWYNDFSGFLIRVVTNDVSLDIDIVIKHEPHEEDSRFELWQESHEAPKPEYIGKGKTHMGYIPFGSLRQTTSMNSSHNIISFSIKSNWTSFAAQLVLRKSKDDTHQTTKATTNSSEFWDKEDHNRKTFEIQQDSESSIKILWRA
uniref:Leucine-rich repeat domain, L domain-containing protein n=1 Tax=Lactuca sativa TaxID=4236 RepID=A0A9R1UZ56_LACSA|nr:hypothetical protein LSAT_V11C700387130 [Lactuca sativa]